MGALDHLPVAVIGRKRTGGQEQESREQPLAESDTHAIAIVMRLGNAAASVTLCLLTDMNVSARYGRPGTGAGTEPKTGRGTGWGRGRGTGGAVTEDRSFQRAKAKRVVYSPAAGREKKLVVD